MSICHVWPYLGGMGRGVLFLRLDGIVATSPGSMNGARGRLWTLSLLLLKDFMLFIRNSVLVNPTALARLSRVIDTTPGSEALTLHDEGCGELSEGGVETSAVEDGIGCTLDMNSKS